MRTVADDMEIRRLNQRIMELEAAIKAALGTGTLGDAENILYYILSK